ncbi:MAG: hypothetical protein JW786_11710 [Desulfobacterales bacterium]|nr:hypothetical protein [Desulfobacterales bacterium]
MYSRDKNLFRQLGFCNPLWSLAIIAFLIPFSACALQMEKPPFDARNCLENVPRHVEGLKILSGPRSERSIICDMRQAVCNGQVLFEHFQAKDKTLQSGRVVFRVLVEYTGEVYSVTVEDNTIKSGELLYRVSQFIMGTDFIFWGGDDSETIFLYPMQFGY